MKVVSWPVGDCLDALSRGVGRHGLPSTGGANLESGAWPHKLSEGAENPTACMYALPSALGY